MLHFWFGPAGMCCVDMVHITSFSSHAMSLIFCVPVSPIIEEFSYTEFKLVGMGSVHLCWCRSIWVIQDKVQNAECFLGTVRHEEPQTFLIVVMSSKSVMKHLEQFT